MALPPAQSNPDPVVRILPDSNALENQNRGFVSHGTPGKLLSETRMA
jgi:hypothetical protein